MLGGLVFSLIIYHLVCRWFQSKYKGLLIIYSNLVFLFSVSPQNEFIYLIDTLGF
jgi:hypothetical protein